MIEHRTTPEESLGLREYLDILRRRKWYIVATTLVVVALTLLWVSRQVPMYQSTSRVLVRNPSLSPGQPVGGLINMETESSLAASPEVAEIAKQALEFEGETASLLEGLSVEPQPETEILVFTYHHLRGETAEARSQAFADAYLEFRRQQILNEILQASQSVQEQIDTVQEELADVNEELSETTDETQRQVLQTRASSLAAQLSFLQQSLVLPSGGLEVGQVIQPATGAFAPSSATTRAVLALFVGLAVGIGLALLVERLDEGLKGRRDLEVHTTAPVLAVVPKIAQWKRNEDALLAVSSAPDSPAAEAYRTLRTGILFAASQRLLGAILVTSAETNEGKSTTTANLGVALARAGKRVILVSGDLRRPRLQAFFGVKSSMGLTNVLAGEQLLETVLVQPRGMSNLRILPSGPVPGNPAELLTSNAMKKTMLDLREQADIVLIDGAPILAVSDSLVLCRLVDAVLLVAHAHRTRRSAVDQARHQLHQVEAELIGSVLNNLDPRKASGYANYDGYYYARKA